MRPTDHTTPLASSWKPSSQHNSPGDPPNSCPHGTHHSLLPSKPTFPKMLHKLVPPAMVGRGGLGDLLEDKPGLVLGKSQPKLSKLCPCPHPMISLSPRVCVWGVDTCGRHKEQGPPRPQYQAWVSRHSPECSASPGDRGPFHEGQLGSLGSVPPSVPRAPLTGVQPQSGAGHRGGTVGPREWDPDPVSTLTQRGL